MWLIRSFLILAGVIAVLWLGMENADQTVDFTFFTKVYWGLKLTFLLMIVFVTGMVFSYLISVVNEIALRRQLTQARRELTRMDREIAALRSLPLEDTEGFKTGSPV